MMQTTSINTFLHNQILNNNIFLDNDSKYLKKIFDTFMLDYLSVNYWNNLTKNPQHNLIKQITKYSCPLTLLIMQNILTYQLISFFKNNNLIKMPISDSVLSKTTIISCGTNIITNNENTFIFHGKTKYFIGLDYFDYVILAFKYNDYEYYSLVPRQQLLNHSKVIQDDLITCNSINIISFIFNDLKISIDQVICKQSINNSLLFDNSLKILSSIMIEQINKILMILKESTINITDKKINECYLMLFNKLHQLEQNYLINDDHTLLLSIKTELDILGINCILFAEQICKSLLIFNTNKLYQIKKEMTIFRVLNMSPIDSLNECFSLINKSWRS